jgi:hypothetical protein
MSSRVRTRPDRRPRAVSSRLAGVEVAEPIRSVSDLQTRLHGLPEHSAHLAIAVDSLSVSVHEWERPIRRWSGRPGQIDNLQSLSAQYPYDEPGVARVDVELSKPTPLADVIRGVYPMLGVNRGQHGYGFVELATADAPPEALALLPTRTAPGIPDLPSRHLEGMGLGVGDLGLVGTTAMLEELQAQAEDPALTQVHHPLLVAPGGHLAVSERLEMPLIDLNLHNPIGRLHTFDLPPGSLALTLEDGYLVFTVAQRGPATGIHGAGPRDGGPMPVSRQYTAAYDAAVDELTGWSRPPGIALTGPEVRRLRSIEAVDLSGLVPDSSSTETLLYQRLAELAATGVVLHSLPDVFKRADDVLGPDLADLLRTPFRPSWGLVRELRTVPQRRLAMQRFGGFFELAEHADHLGHRLLPTVSVVMSSMRPSRAAEVITSLAAQRYPHLEIAVALHGVDAPVSAEFEEAVRQSGAQVFRYELSTPFGAVLADTARRTTGDLVVKIDDDDVYGPRVIEDLVLAYLYSNADIVGKTTEYLYFEETHHTVHRTFRTELYHTQLAGGAMMMSRGVLNDIGGWRPTPHSTDRSILIRIGNHGGVAYRTQSLGYIYVRHSDGHTWKPIDSTLVRNSPEQWPRFMHEIVEA